MRKEFEVHLLNDRGINAARNLAEIFSDCLERIEIQIPAGRERSLVVTKLQEAAYFAKLAVALDPQNQKT